MPLLCYCIQIKFYQFSQDKNALFVILAVCCWSRLDALASFSRVSSVLCFGVTWSVRAPSGKPLLRDVTGKALLCSRCSVVLRHWHGPRLHKWLVSKVRVQRTGARWRAQLRGVSEMFKPCSRESERQKRRERARRSRVVLNRPTFDIAHRRLVQSERRYGAEPRLHGCFFCKASLCDDK